MRHPMAFPKRRNRAQTLRSSAASAAGLPKFFGGGAGALVAKPRSMDATQSAEARVVQEVVAELKWASRVDERTIEVTSSDGVVTLRGTAPSWPAREAAAAAAHRVAGVLDVVNELRVRAPDSFRRTDLELAKAVRHALEWDVAVPHDRIGSTVSDGVVTLQGSVDSWDEHDDVIQCVRNLSGVIELKSLIEVDPQPPPLDPAGLEASIASALARHARHAAKHVRVEVTGGRVVLRGSVPSSAERNVILGAVRGTPGVGHIDNRLVLFGSPAD